MRRMKIAAALGLLALLFLIAPESRATTERDAGWASAYAPGVMEGVVSLRFEQDIWRVEPPGDGYTVAGYVAAMDCARVGEVTTLTGPDGRGYRVLIADCAGADGEPGRFEARGIIVELDWRMWERLTAAHGRPLAVELAR